MYASTVGGGAMTLVFRPATSDKQAIVSAVKVPVAGTPSRKTKGAPLRK